MLLRLQKEL